MDQRILDPDVVEYALYMQGEKLGFSKHEVLEYARAGQVIEHIDDFGNRSWSIDGAPLQCGAKRVRATNYNAKRKRI